LSLTRNQIVADALSHGRSLAGQEQWVAGVQAGVADADQGDFALQAHPIRDGIQVGADPG
jgi:predicted transcriptional regulator